MLEQDLLPPPRDSDDTAELEKKMANATIGGGQSTTTKKERDVRKWFETCFEQVGNLCKTIGDSIASEAPIS